MRILVTGTGGFVGGVVARHFSRAGHHVIANYHRAPPRLPEYLIGVESWQGDIRQAGCWELSFDALVHCAAALPSRIDDAKLLFEINAAGTEALLECARRCAAVRVINLSSMSAYGPISEPVVGAATPCDPQEP